MTIVISSETIEEARFALKERIERLSKIQDESRISGSLPESASDKYWQSAIADAQAAYEELGKVAHQ